MKLYLHRVCAVEENIACEELVVYICEALGLHSGKDKPLVLSRSGIPHKRFEDIVDWPTSPGIVTSERSIPLRPFLTTFKSKQYLPGPLLFPAKPRHA